MRKIILSLLLGTTLSLTPLIADAKGRGEKRLDDGHPATDKTAPPFSSPSSKTTTYRQRGKEEIKKRIAARNAAIAELVADIEAKDAKIAELTAGIEAKDADIKEIAAGMKAREAEIIKQTIVRDRETAELTAGIAAKDTKIAELTADMEAKDAEIAKNKEILDGTIKDRDNLVKALKAERQRLANEKRLVNRLKNAGKAVHKYTVEHDPLMVASPTVALLNWYNQNQTIAFENDPNAPNFANLAAYAHHELTQGSLVPYAQVPHIFAGLIHAPWTHIPSATAIAVPAMLDLVRLASHAYRLINDPTHAPYLYATTTLSDVVDGAYSPLVLASIISRKLVPLAMAIPVGKMTGDVTGHIYDMVPAQYDPASYISRETVTRITNPLAALTTIIAACYYKAADFSGVRRMMMVYGLYQGVQVALQRRANGLAQELVSSYLTNTALEAASLTGLVALGGPVGWVGALGYGALQTQVGQTWVAKPVGNALSDVYGYIMGPQQQEMPAQ